MKHRLCVVSALAPLTIALPASAQDVTRLTVETTATVGVSNNPFSEVGRDLGSAFYELRAQPTLKVESSVQKLAASGFVEVQDYLRKYSSAVSYGGDLDYRRDLSPTLAVHSAAFYESRILGTRFENGGIESPSAPPLINPDLGLFGTRDRQNKFHVTGDVTSTLSPRDRLSANLFGSVLRYQRFADLGDYNGWGGGLGYDRTLSERTEAGIQASVASYDYRGLQGDSDIVTAQGKLSQKLGTSWNLSAAVGISLIARAERRDSAAFSGNLTLCRDRGRGAICVNASRSVLPTAISGTQTQTSANATYRYRLDEQSNIRLSGEYSAFENPDPIIVGGNRYLSALATYDQTLRRSIGIISSVFYRQVFGGIGPRPADLGARIGVSYIFGGQR